MKFDICVGNPPYGSRNKGSSRFLHYMILKTALTFCSDKLTFIMPSKPIIKQLEDEWYKMFTTAVCTNIQTVDKSAFPNTTMDKTAIYYCDRKASPNDYDKQLDVDKKIYNAIDAEGHRLFIDKMNKVKPIEIKTNTRSSRDEELKKVILDSALNSLEDGKYYLNTNRANGALGAKLISGDLFDIDVLNKDEEEKFIKDIHSGEKNIIECRTKEYGKNLKKMMTSGYVLRYGLWLTQINKHIYQEQYKYVPDIDYTTIDTDEKLLSVCGFSDDEIMKILNYLKYFDFTRNRNEEVRNYNNSSSGS